MKKILSIICFSVIIISASFTVKAESNYEEYVYNTAGESVASPQTYSPLKVIYGNEETAVAFSSPQDICTDKNNNLYLLDSGNNRLLVYDEHLNLKNVYVGSKIENQDVSFEGCTGIFTNNGEIYIADKQKGLIYVLGMDGSGKRIIPFVPQPVVEEGFIYKPTRITVDESGVIQVQAEGCYTGLITLNQNGEMIGYFSANTVQPSFSVIAAQFWRKIFSDEQQDRIKQIVPIEYSSITMDNDGFIYTVTKSTENSTFEIKKLNPYGKNIMGYNDKYPNIKIGNGNYGDQRIYRSSGTDIDTAFCDVYVDESGFVFGLDASRGRVFQYDQNSNLVSVFGGMGDQVGTFIEPIAVDGNDKNVFVLDATKGCLTVFEPKEYVENIRKAILLDNECKYDEAAVYWNKVYNDNCNYSLALMGLGKVAYQNGDFETAFDYFEKSEDRANYDIALTAYRTEFIRDNITIIVISVVFVFILIFVLNKIIRKRRLKNGK